MARLVDVFIVRETLELELLRVPKSVIDSCVAVGSSIPVGRLGIALRVLESVHSVEMDEKVGD